MPRTTALLSLLVSLVLLATLVHSGRTILHDGTCPPLPAPSGTIVDVSTVDELLDAVSTSDSNTTIPPP